MQQHHTYLMAVGFVAILSGCGDGSTTTSLGTPIIGSPITPPDPLTKYDGLWARHPQRICKFAYKKPLRYSHESVEYNAESQTFILHYTFFSTPDCTGRVVVTAKHFYTVNYVGTEIIKGVTVDVFRLKDGKITLSGMLTQKFLLLYEDNATIFLYKEGNYLYHTDNSAQIKRFYAPLEPMVRIR